jgi:hypothetical protein
MIKQLLPPVMGRGEGALHENDMHPADWQMRRT